MNIFLFFILFALAATWFPILFNGKKDEWHIRFLMIAVLVWQFIAFFKYGVFV